MGADLETRDMTRGTQLLKCQYVYLCTSKVNWSIVFFFQKKKAHADLEARDTWNKTALLLAAEMGGHKVPRFTCFTRTLVVQKYKC